jgi:hypothetical protein
MAVAAAIGVIVVSIQSYFEHTPKLYTASE